MIALDPTLVRKVAAFAEAIRSVETQFGFTLEAASDGLAVGGASLGAPGAAPFVLVRVAEADDMLAVGVRQ